VMSKKQRATLTNMRSAHLSISFGQLGLPPTRPVQMAEALPIPDIPD